MNVYEDAVLLRMLSEENEKIGEKYFDNYTHSILPIRETTGGLEFKQKIIIIHKT